MKLNFIKAGNMTLANYQFLPWVREGLGNTITDVDTLTKVELRVEGQNYPYRWISIVS